MHAMEVEVMPIASLKPYPRNARTHSKKQIKQIANSIQRFGFTNPVLISDENEIVAGHGRVEAAKLLGYETVPTLRLAHLNAAERRAYVIADNKLALNAGWDREILAIELQGLIDTDFDIELSGFSLAEVDIVLEEAQESAVTGSAGPEDNLPPLGDAASAVSLAGDLWQLGPAKHPAAHGQRLGSGGANVPGSAQGPCRPYTFIDDPLRPLRWVSSSRGVWRHIPLESWSWLSLQRAQA